MAKHATTSISNQVWHAVEVEHLKIPSLKRTTFSYLKLGGKMEDDELPTQSIPFFTAFWFLQRAKQLTYSTETEKIRWFPNECMVELRDFHPKMVHGSAWYYIDACFNLLFWIGLHGSHFFRKTWGDSLDTILICGSMAYCISAWCRVFFCLKGKKWRLFTVVYSFSRTPLSAESGGVFEKGTIVGEYIHFSLNQDSLEGSG